MIQGYLAIIVAKQTAKIAIKGNANEDNSPVRAIGFDVSYNIDADESEEE